MCLCALLRAVWVLLQTIVLMFGFDSVLLQDAGLLALVAAAQTADAPSSLRAKVGVRGDRRAPRKR